MCARREHFGVEKRRARPRRRDNDIGALERLGERVGGDEFGLGLRREAADERPGVERRCIENGDALQLPDVREEAELPGVLGTRADQRDATRLGLRERVGGDSGGGGDA